MRLNPSNQITEQSKRRLDNQEVISPTDMHRTLVGDKEGDRRMAKTEKLRIAGDWIAGIARISNLVPTSSAGFVHSIEFLKGHDFSRAENGPKKVAGFSVCVRTTEGTCIPQQGWATREYVAI